MRSFRSVRLAAVLTVLGTVLVGCGGGSGDSDATAGTSGSTASGGKAGKRTFVYAVPDVPASVDAFPFTGDATRWMLVARKSTLIDYDVDKVAGRGCEQVPTNDDVVGTLVDSWKLSRDKKTITLSLKDTGSQYGNKLSAEDVKWSVERSFALAPFMADAMGVNGRFDVKRMISIVDEKTVDVHLKEPFPYAVPLLGNNTMPIFDSREAKKHATKKDPWASKWLATHIADFGPWKLDSFTASSEIVMSQNPHYTGPRGNIDTLVLRKVPEASVRTQLLQSGDADYAARLSYDEYTTLQSSSGVKVTPCASLNRDLLVLNEKDPRFKDVRVRQAVSMAIDRDALVKSVYGGFAAPAKYGFTQFLQMPKSDVEITADVEKAKQLLTEAGYPNGFSLDMIYSAVRPGPVVSQLAPVLQSMLGKVGIKVTLKNVAGSADFFEAYNGGNYQSAIYSEGNILSDPTWIGTYFLASTGTNNTFGFKNEEYDATLAKAREATSTTERDALYAKLSTLAVTQAPVVYLTDDKSIWAFRDGVSGLGVRPQGELVPSDLTVK